MKESDKYLKLVEWSEEDQCYVGSVPGWVGKCCHGDDEMKVYQELCLIVDEWIEIYKKDGRHLPPATSGKKYSGKFVLRTEPDFHQALAIRALNEGESLNNFVVKTLKRVVSN
jgi:predicted HicB family RNase H-like nuclease